MAWQLPPHLGLSFASAVVAVAVAAFAARNRDTAGAVPLAVVMAAVAVWTLASTLQAASTTLGAKLFWVGVEYVGIAVLPAGWLLFALEYTGREEWVTRRTLGLLAVEPALLLATVWTNRFHYFFRTDAWLTEVGPYVVLETAWGPGFFLHVTYTYLVVLAGMGLLLRAFLTADHLYRSQAVALLVGVSAPLVGSGLFVAGVLRFSVDPTPLSFIVTGLALTWAIFRHRLLDLVPVTREMAREQLVASMSEAALVVDERGRVVDLNPAAGAVVEGSVPSVVGRPLDEVVPELAAAADLDGDAAERTAVTIERGPDTRHYDVLVSPFGGDSRALTGSLLVMQDVTERRRQRQRLMVLNRVLRHDVRNHLTVMLGQADDLLRDDVDAEPAAERIRERGRRIAELGRKAREIEETLADDGEPERHDLVAVVEDVLEDVARDYPAVAVEVDLPDRAAVYANDLLDSAVHNVVENAVEHNDSDDPQLRVAASRRGEFVELVVADNGPGIPTEERRVLERGTETSLQHSSGLGLWIVNWVVTESGGEIGFAENDPRGTVVTMRFPAAEDGEAPSDATGRG